MKELKKGVLPPMITPFTTEGDVDYAAFEYNVAKWNDNDLAGYLVLGSNSETAFLSEEEKTELIKITVATAKKDRYVLAGTGIEGLRETIRFTNLSAKLGVDAALVLTPCYYDAKMDSKNLIKYFTALADNSDIPILIYNVPKFTHVNIKADAVAELSRHPNIIGMKDSLGDIAQISTFLNVKDDSFNVMVGTASVWYPALTLGIKNGIHALANCCPDQCASVQRLYDAGKSDEARVLHQRILPINTAVTGTYGIPGLKHACDRMGLKGGKVRLPLLNASDDAKAGVDKILANAGVI